MNLTAERLNIIVTDEGVIRLPKAGTNAEMRKKLGMKVLEESDSWYYLVKLPEGWNVVCLSDVYDEECYIVDQNQTRRIRLIVELRADGTVLAATAQVYKRFYTTLEANERERTVYLRDHMNPAFSMAICKCQRPYTDFDDLGEPSECILASMKELERSYPGCNDITIWDGNPLEELEKFQRDYQFTVCKKNAETD